MQTIEIQELIDFIIKSGLEVVQIETNDVKLYVKRPAVPVVGAPTGLASVVPVVHQDLPLSTMEKKDGYTTITAPMVGTFYRAPNPEAAPFVKEGDLIVKGTKLCIIEAMKLYNEIEAELSGKIIKILVDDVTPVEYDQPLFIVEPV